MAQFIKNKEIPFGDFIKLMQDTEKYFINEMNGFAEKLAYTYNLICPDTIDLCIDNCLDKRKVYISFKNRKSVNLILPYFKYVYSSSYNNVSSSEIKEITKVVRNYYPLLNQLVKFHHIKIKGKLVINNLNYSYLINHFSTACYPIRPRLCLELRSIYDKLDLFEIDLLTGNIFSIINGKEVLLNDELKNKIINNMPNISLNYIPRFIKKKFLKNANYLNGNLDIEETKEIEEPENISFLEAINKNEFNEELSTNMEDIIATIKRLLTNLKNNKKVLKDYQKIKLTNKIFFKSNTDKRKEIDEFFNDPEIIINCNLSKINFKDADIRGFYLANTDARINLNDLYLKSIKGTNLKNVNLCFQTLDDIDATGANLEGTFITIFLNKSIIDNTTSFGFDATFMLNNSVLKADEVKEFGINIVEEEKSQTLHM